MKHILSILLLLVLPGIGNSQEQAVTATNLENIIYPFPVKYISLNIQGENLQMAYMDVQPQRAMVKHWFYYMVKTSVALTGSRRQET